MTEVDHAQEESAVVDPVDRDEPPPPGDDTARGAGDPGPPQMEYFEKGKQAPEKT
jgi:hypothetical protein